MHNDKEMKPWIEAGRIYGGSFVKAVIEAAYCADDDNYVLMRPWLLQLKEKYSHYGTRIVPRPRHFSK